MKTEKEAYSTPELTVHGDVEKLAAPGPIHVQDLEVPIEEFVEALNDPTKAEGLMKKMGWEKKDLIARAELLTRELAGQSAAQMV